MKILENAKRNKTTTITGVVAALAVTFTALWYTMDGNPATDADWGVVIGFWMAAFGFSQAPDADKVRQ